MREMCSNCRFFSVNSSPSIGNACVRYPPTLVKGTYSDEGKWPPTYADRWCGEWRGLEDFQSRIV